MLSRILTVILCSTIINPLFSHNDENYDSGKVRIANIITNDQSGVAAHLKNHTHYAETQNLAADLNIAEIAQFFECKTLIGQSYMIEALKLPMTQHDKNSVLARRQSIIKALVENKEFKHEVDQMLESAKKDEQEIIQLMSEFFIGKTCPELANLELIKKQNPKLYPFFNFFHSGKIGLTLKTIMNAVGMAGTIYGTYHTGKITYLFTKAGLNPTGPAMATAYFGLIAAIYSYMNYKDYTTATEKRLKLHALNQFIKTAERFEALCTNNAVECQFTLSNIKDSQGIHLIKKLQHSRYQNKKTKLFIIPYVHSLLYELYQQDTHLAQIFACIAEMDVYNAIATKIVESQQQKNKFCFVTFVEDKKPTINAQSFWNILVKDAVSNDITEDKHIILTGPNAGGKTTTIRALLQNIVLGQSFGIAAAEKFECTMFDVIHSYLNISDDLINGLSLFASEVKRAKDVLQRIKNLDENKKFFFALDELFTGTVAQDGETCAYNFIKNIAKFDNILFIYATHFNKLKELGNEGSYCTNYKVDAPTKNSDGKLIYPFTLSKGANEARVALDLAHEALLFT